MKSPSRQFYLEEALDSLNQALVILDRDWYIVYTSPSAAQILAMKDGLVISGQRMMAALETDNTLLNASLEACCQRDEAAFPQEVHILRPSGKIPFKLRINPIHCGEGDDQDRPAGALVLILDPQANQQAWYERLIDRYDLTPRECECAILLTEGHSMEEVAGLMGITTQTLRKHLKHTFRKTGTHKQHELVGIVLKLLRKR